MSAVKQTVENDQRLQKLCVSKRNIIIQRDTRENKGGHVGNNVEGLNASAVR